MNRWRTIILLTVVALAALPMGAFSSGEGDDPEPQNHVIPAVKKAIGPGELYWLMDRACVQGDTMSVQMLLNAGAEPDGVNDYKHFERFEPVWHLHQAAYGGHVEVVDMLLKAGATVDLQCGEGETALFMAVYYNRAAVVRRLLEAGANASLKVNGKTAIEVARVKGYSDIVSALELAAGSKQKGEQGSDGKSAARSDPTSKGGNKPQPASASGGRSQ
ncbi:ankyrin repeat domain-containing protein [Roseimicrobium sp. ORNL1]|uniref:ankyrin repeat domain-containing protein n=1 Tax=Roseimicrobium sp. ORNL1 TaxID=2711231 RepID=UPI0013E1A814|nr:ankyrin repeat domain-containing protein [Roseimicrobium sp. ORNL1]QIF02388.1 ankyrin repeat domain-containing protein [Roseimicrobium sp. ORNL1]